MEASNKAWRLASTILASFINLWAFWVINQYFLYKYRSVFVTIEIPQTIITYFFVPTLIIFFFRFLTPSNYFFSRLKKKFYSSINRKITVSGLFYSIYRVFFSLFLRAHFFWESLLSCVVSSSSSISVYIHCHAK